MKRIESKPLNASITIGLNKVYSKQKYSLDDLEIALLNAQKELIVEEDIKLSAKVTPCKIVFAGQNEESVTISFINYPKFPMEKIKFEFGINFLAERLMQQLNQNRVVVEFVDKTIMYEDSEIIDPDIEIKS